MVTTDDYASEGRSAVIAGRGRRAQRKYAQFQALRAGGFLTLAPEESAYETFWGWQRPTLLLTGVLVTLALVAWPVVTLMLLNALGTCIYLGMIGFRFYAIARGE